MLGPCHRLAPRAAPRRADLSLLPSATEIIHAIGLGDALVGRSHECDFPAGVERLPAISTARIDSDALDPAQIDAAVAAAIADGEQLYGVSADALAELAPDVVITQTLCRVCAVEGDGVRSALRARALEAEVVELEPEGVDGVLDSIVALGDLLGAAEAARAVVRDGARAARRGGGGRGRTDRAPGWWWSSGPTRPTPPATGCPSWSRSPAVENCWGSGTHAVVRAPPGRSP